MMIPATPLTKSPVSRYARHDRPSAGLSRREVVALGCSALLAGCGGGGAAEEPLTLWTLALSPFFDEYMKERIARFEALHEGVRIKWVDVPYDAIERKLITAAGAGRAPDVVNLPDLSFARFAQAGAFANLSDILPGDPNATYLPSALGMCRLGSKLVCLPWYISPQTLLANTELLDRGGIQFSTLPRQWLKLAPMAADFRSRTRAFLFSQPLGEESQLPIMMLAEGLPLFEVTSGRLTATLTHPEVHAYLSVWRELYRSGAMPRDAATRGHAHLTDLYQSGELALVNTGPNFLKRISNTAPKVFESTTVGPGLVGALGRIHMPVMVLGVLATSRRKQLAAQLAWFLTNDESQLLLCQQAAVMPSTVAALENEFFTGAATSRLDEARVVAASTVRDAVAFTPALDCWPMMRRSFEEAFKSTLLGSTPLARAIEQVNARWNTLLGESDLAFPSAIPTPEPLAEP